MMDRRRMRRSPAGKLVGLAWVAMALLAVTPALADDESDWQGEVAASVNAQTGTTDSFAGSLDATAARDWEKNKLELRFNGVYGQNRVRDEEENDKIIQDTQALTAKYDRRFTERAFVASSGELSRDSISDREVRAAVYVGPGYRAWQGERKTKEYLDLLIGVGYRYELYAITTDLGFPDKDNYDSDHFADGVIGFEYKNLLFEDRLEFTHTATARMPFNDPEFYVLRTEMIFGVPLTEAWSFRTSFFAEYANLNIDKVNDLTTRTTIGLGYKF